MTNYHPAETGATRSLLVASNNQRKIEEFERILSPLGFHITTPSAEHLTLDVPETGSTFAENAILKARAFCRASGLASVADDSGLCVDALGGEPGIYSARYGDPDLTDAGRLDLVLERLRGVDPGRRTARFVSAIALVSPDGSVITSEGAVHGLIGEEPRGHNGFGYDPIFTYPPRGQTFAEMSAAEKDAVSHRSRALRQLVSLLSAGWSAGILR